MTASTAQEGTSVPTPLGTVRQNAQIYADAQAGRDTAREQLLESIRVAHVAGHQPKELIEASRLPRQSVFDAIQRPAPDPAAEPARIEVSAPRPQLRPGRVLVRITPPGAPALDWPDALPAPRLGETVIREDGTELVVRDVVHYPEGSEDGPTEPFVYVVLDSTRPDIVSYP